MTPEQIAKLMCERGFSPDISAFPDTTRIPEGMAWARCVWCGAKFGLRRSMPELVRDAVRAGWRVDPPADTVLCPACAD